MCMSPPTFPVKFLVQLKLTVVQIVYCIHPNAHTYTRPHTLTHTCDLRLGYSRLGFFFNDSYDTHDLFPCYLHFCAFLVGMPGWP